MGEKDIQELLAVAKRTTAAARSIAVIILGPIPWILGALVPAILGVWIFLEGWTDEDLALAALLFISSGILALVGIVTSVVKASSELRKSKE